MVRKNKKCQHAQNHKKVSKELMEHFNLAAKYLMVIGGNSASPSFAALDQEHGSLPLCLKRSFRPIWGPQQYSYKPPLVALPGGNNANEIPTNLELITSH